MTTEEGKEETNGAPPHAASHDEPNAKKPKTTASTGWERHKLNVSEMLIHSDEVRHFKDLVEESISILQGIGPHATEILEHLGPKTIKELAHYKFFQMARALKTLSETETENGRAPGSVMNVDKAVDKKYESMTLKEIVASPVSALEGLSEAAAEQLQNMGVQTISDLANYKYFHWAEAICEIAKYENYLTAAERKKERELKRLA